MDTPQTLTEAAPVMTTEATPLMPLEAWIEQFARHPFEWIDGAKIPMSPSVFGSTQIANALRDAMNVVVNAQKLGAVYLELSIAFTEGSDWVRRSLVPDIAYISAAKLAAFRAKYPVVPDLVAEIVSPTDLYMDVRRKVTRYLEEGVRLVWVVDYVNEVVEVFTAQGGHEHRKSDTLTANPIR
ncbi:MAG: Uma2 family endonuclease [Anaerolineae bacterium]|nr:Uma2 family endonuclease [Anaerolineae bacterium]